MHFRIFHIFQFWVFIFSKSCENPPSRLGGLFVFPVWAAPRGATVPRYGDSVRLWQRVRVGCDPLQGVWGEEDDEGLGDTGSAGAHV